VPRAERYALGRGLRRQAPRSDLATWDPESVDRDPIGQIQQSHQGRLEWLVPVRVSRMAASPYGFLRGAAVVMAEDFSQLPMTRITPVICGDAHLGNFGFYASPERDLVLDLNDFDEAHPGSWEWDLRRLATSVWVAGRQNGASEDACGEAAQSCASSYRHHIRYLAGEPLLTRSFERVTVRGLEGSALDRTLLAEITRAAKRARTRTSDRALPRFTTSESGERRIVEEPPVITRLSEEESAAVAASLDDYLLTLAPHWRRLLGGYTIVDIAHKVVGVGSVGLRAYVVLCEGSSPEDVIFLQLKQARRSVVAPFVHPGAAWHAHQGQRVVEYQQALQTVSDPLLGWTTVGERQYYVRQWRDMKGTVPIEAVTPAALAEYAAVCGRLLAKGHARTSGASMIAGYVGRSERLDEALCTFARAYADQTERDHQAFVRAVARGALPSEHGA
jgi:uncharacterized protein (DUF2252 family)